MNNKIDRRYENDSAFHMAVDYIYALIAQAEGELTPLDIRDACYLARLKYELTNVRPIIMSKNSPSQEDIIEYFKKNSR